MRSASATLPTSPTSPNSSASPAHPHPHHPLYQIHPIPPLHPHLLNPLFSLFSLHPHIHFTTSPTSTSPTSTSPTSPTSTSPTSPLYPPHPLHHTHFTHFTHIHFTHTHFTHIHLIHFTHIHFIHFTTSSTSTSSTSPRYHFTHFTHIHFTHSIHFTHFTHFTTSTSSTSPHSLHPLHLHPLHPLISTWPTSRSYFTQQNLLCTLAKKDFMESAKSWQRCQRCFTKQLRTILITSSTVCSQRVVDLASSPSVEMKTKQLKITCAGHAHSDVMNRYKRGEQGPKTLLWTWCACEKWIILVCLMAVHDPSGDEAIAAQQGPPEAVWVHHWVQGESGRFGGRGGGSSERVGVAVWLWGVAEIVL